MRFLPLAAAALLAASSAHALDFKPALRADARGLYQTQQVSAKSGWGESADVFLVPALDFGRQLTLSPVLAYLLQGRGLVIEEETFFTQRHLFLAKPVLRQGLNDAWGVKAWGSAKRAINRETDAEVWSTGLYDWEEFGGGLGLDWKPGRLNVDKAVLGLELQHRTYPNWHEAGASLSRNRNYYTKDYNGLKLSLDLNSPRKQALTWDTGLTWLDKAYTDALLVNQDGTFNFDQLRNESLLRWDLNAGLGLTQSLRLRAGLNLDWNASNQNFFDSVFNVPQMDFYSYLSSGLDLGLDWVLGRGLLAFDVGLTNRVYSGRSLRNPDGSYTNGKQADLEQRYSLDARYPVWLKGLYVVGGASYLNAQSNQGFQVKLRSSYDLFSADLGLRYEL